MLNCTDQLHLHKGNSVHILEIPILELVPGPSSYCMQYCPSCTVCPPMPKLTFTKRVVLQREFEQRNANTFRSICAFASVIYFIFIKKRSELRRKLRKVFPLNSVLCPMKAQGWNQAAVFHSCE